MFNVVNTVKKSEGAVNRIGNMFFWFFFPLFQYTGLNKQTNNITT